MSKKKTLILFIGVIGCSILSAPFISSWYSLYITPISNWFWGPSHPEYLTGFALSFIFFGSLLSWLFAPKQKKYWLFYTLPFLIFILLLGAFEELIIGISLAIVGWLIGQLSLFVQSQKNKLK